MTAKVFLPTFHISSLDRSKDTILDTGIFPMNLLQ